MIKLTHIDIKSHQIILSISMVLTTSQAWLVAILNIASRHQAVEYPYPYYYVYIVINGSLVPVVNFGCFHSPVPVTDHRGSQLAPALSRRMNISESLYIN